MSAAADYADTTVPATSGFLPGQAVAGGFLPGQAVEVYSKSNGTWVDAAVVGMLADSSVRVRYGSLYKIIPRDYQTSLLRRKPAVESKYARNQTVEVYSKSQDKWVLAVVRELLADGSIHVQYRDTQHLFKVIAPTLQPSTVRPPRAAERAPEPPPSDPGADRVAQLVQEAERLRAAIEKQQREITATQQAAAQLVPMVEHTVGCWSCMVCTFENVEPLTECEMCSAKRKAPSSQAAQKAVVMKKPAEHTRARNPVLAGPLLEDAGDASHLMRQRASQLLASQGSREFLKQAEEAWQSQCPGQLQCPPLRVAGRSCEDLLEVAVANTPPLQLPRALHERLRPYQHDGVAWMWQLFHKGHGGVLADEMGLGKTAQACGLIQAARSVGAKHALVLVPVTLLEQWAKETHTWCPDCPVYIYHGSTVHRSGAARAVMREHGGVLLTSYALVKSGDERLLQVSEQPAPESARGKRPMDGTTKAGSRVQLRGLVRSEQLNGMQGRIITQNEDNRVVVELDTGQQVNAKAENLRLVQSASGNATTREKPWDVVICDEAHVMRSISTLVGKAVRKIRSSCRILLTATPVQNALQDLWALMDFAQPGLLGNHATFVKTFNDPIEKGSMRCATPSASALKRHLCEQLWEMIKPHMLRRTKEAVGLLAGLADGAAQSCTSAKALPPKHETVIWLLPTEDQVRIYQKALETSDAIHEASSQTKLGVEVFQAIALLKRLCNHPALGLPLSQPKDWREFLSTAAEGVVEARELAMMGGSVAEQEHEHCEEPEEVRVDGSLGGDADKHAQKMKRDASSIVAQSAKLRCLSALLPALNARGHRTLVFSQGVKMLDLLEICVLRKLGISYLRIDGDIDVAMRNDRVSEFQSQPAKYACLLLTTSIGGCGLNLTGADRVIIVDPAWNPASDMQAVDRAHRIGQEKEVRTYRLVVSGLIEDKMFRLQVFKMGLMRTALEAQHQQRYFTADEIHRLFEWTDPARGETRQLLMEKHREEEVAAVHEDSAYQGWATPDLVVGMSDFSALYKCLAKGEEIEDTAPEVRELKMKVNVADQEADRAAEARQCAEGRLTSAQESLEAVEREISAAASARSAAAGALKVAQHELQLSRRREAASEKQVEKAVDLQLAVKKQQAALDVGKARAQELAATTERALCKSEIALEAADSGLLHATAGVDAKLSCVGVHGDSGNTTVAAAASSVGLAKQVWERLQRAVDASRVACTSAKATSFAAKGKYVDLDQVPEAAEKECAREEKAMQKMSEQLASANEHSAQVFVQMLENVSSLANELRAADGVSPSQEKAFQSELKALVRTLAAAWQCWKAACDAHGKAATQHHKAACAMSKAAANYRHVVSKVAAADTAHSSAMQQLEARITERSQCEAAVDAAATARTAARHRVAGQKRKREECRSSLATAKQALKSARLTEKEASASRTALYRHYAGEGFKGELRGGRRSAQARAQEAIEALQQEEYDANQVVDAYEWKKKLRQEAEDPGC